MATGSASGIASQCFDPPQLDVARPSWNVVPRPAMFVQWSPREFARICDDLGFLFVLGVAFRTVMRNAPFGQHLA